MRISAPDINRPFHALSKPRFAGNDNESGEKKHGPPGFELPGFPPLPPSLYPLPKFPTAITPFPPVGIPPSIKMDDTDSPAKLIERETEKPVDTQLTPLPRIRLPDPSECGIKHEVPAQPTAPIIQKPTTSRRKTPQTQALQNLIDELDTTDSGEKPPKKPRGEKSGLPKEKLLETAPKMSEHTRKMRSWSFQRSNASFWGSVLMSTAILIPAGIAAVVVHRLSSSLQWVAPLNEDNVWDARNFKQAPLAPPIQQQAAPAVNNQAVEPEPAKDNRQLPGDAQFKKRAPHSSLNKVIVVTQKKIKASRHALRVVMSRKIRPRQVYM